MRAARAYQNVDRHTAVISGNTVDLVILLYEKLLQRFREARHTHEHRVSAGEQRRDEIVHHGRLANDTRANLGGQCAPRRSSERNASDQLPRALPGQCLTSSSSLAAGTPSREMSSSSERARRSPSLMR